MAPIELLQATRVRPFEPFRIVLSDGTGWDVTHPEALAVGVRTSYYGVPSAENPELADRFVRLDNLHITQIVPLTAEQR